MLNTLVKFNEKQKLGVYCFFIALLQPANVKKFISSVTSTPLENIQDPLSGFCWNYEKVNFVLDLHCQILLWTILWLSCVETWAIGRLSSLDRSLSALWPLFREVHKAKERPTVGWRLSRAPGGVTRRRSFWDSAGLSDHLRKLCEQISLQITWGTLF